MMLSKLIRVCFKSLTWLNKIIPKNRKSIFFYSNLGFRDNVKALFDYMVKTEYQKDYKIVCAVNDFEQYLELEQNNIKFVGKKRGILYFLRAKYGFYSFGKYPIKPSKNQIIVNLWHGMPLKRIGNMEPSLAEVDYNYFTYLLATSDFYAEIMKKCFNCNDHQIMISGQPRTDELYNQNTEEDLIIKARYQKVIVWFPTYRYSEKQGDINADKWPIPLITIQQAELLNEKLREANCKMIIKLHPLQYSEEIKQISNIEILNDMKMQKTYGNVYRLLRLSDALITDYSSIYFDYLLLDRPIGFTVDDIEAYGKERGFVFEDPSAYMPGTSIKSFKDIKDFISDLLKGFDIYENQRNQINNLVNNYQDGENCARICGKIFGE